MIKIKFQNTDQYIQCEFSRIGSNVVQLLGEVPATTVGFETFRNEDNDQPTKLGDFSDYTTIYKVLDNGVQFSNDGSVYTDEPIMPIEITLEQAKQNKIAEFKRLRDAEELSPIEYSGYRWDFDEKAQMRINGAIIALGENTITWTSADNQEIKKVTADDLRGVIGEAALRSNALHIKYRELKAQVEACETIEDVEKVEW